MNFGNGMEGAAMDRAVFHSRLIQASTMLRAWPEDFQYWRGYVRGLRRLHFGASFCTDAEHDLWLAAADSLDRESAELGRGYRDGLAAIAQTH